TSPSSYCYSHCPHLVLHSFPTRRSSDLVGHTAIDNHGAVCFLARALLKSIQHLVDSTAILDIAVEHFVRFRKTIPVQHQPNDNRSEEHTSELQSRVDLVCRLLLEKKK